MQTTTSLDAKKQKRNMMMQTDSEAVHFKTLTSVFSNRNIKLNSLDTAGAKAESKPNPFRKTLYYFARHPKEAIKLPNLKKSTDGLSNEEVIQLSGPKPVLTLGEVLSKDVMQTLAKKPKRNLFSSVKALPTVEGDLTRRVEPRNCLFQSPINKVRFELIEGVSSLGREDVTRRYPSRERVKKAFEILEKVAEEKSLFDDNLTELIAEIKKGIYCSPGSFRAGFPFDYFEGNFGR